MGWFLNLFREDYPPPRRTVEEQAFESACNAHFTAVECLHRAQESRDDILRFCRAHDIVPSARGLRELDSWVTRARGLIDAARTEMYAALAQIEKKTKHAQPGRMTVLTPPGSGDATNAD